MSIGRNNARKNETNKLFGVDISRGLYSVANQAKDYIGGIINPSDNRASNSGIPKGGERSSASFQPAKFENEDWRVRLSVPQGNPYFYNDPSNTVLSPLRATSGLIWPYTPQVMLSHSAAYASTQPAHSNYAQFFYGSSSVDMVQVTGEFTAQNQLEASYIVAAVTFLRSVTKMFYGNDPNAGTPPPVLRLNGYGDHIFKDVPVVVTTFNADFGGDVDYINAFVTSSGSQQETQIVGNTRADGSGADVTETRRPSVERPTRVPTRTAITVGLQPLYSRKQMRAFGLSDFAAGRLIDKGGFI